MMALKLVEDGLLDLDEDVNEKLITWKVPENEFTLEQKVTLRRLLCHNAGTTVHGFGGYELGTELPSLPQILDGESPANSKPVRVVREPGVKHVYSGGGTTIMQLMCMDVAGKDFPSLMHDTVLKPAGMTSSAFDQPLSTERIKMAAKAHKINGSLYPGGYHVYPENAAAGLWTTSTDLARFLLEIQATLKGEGNILKRETMGEMLTPHLSKDRNMAHPIIPYNWGLGFTVSRTPSGAYFGHSGGNAGFGCYMVSLRESGIGAVVMTNGSFGAMVCLEILFRIAKV
jgi:CubicO group peptidase (beta-lactamase class C family)